jgi:hypothetical protein
MMLRRSATFDDIMAQTSIIGALEKNKIAYAKLNTFVKDLDNKCIEEMLKIDHEKMQNHQHKYNLDREIRNNSKNFKKLKEEMSQPKPLDPNQRIFNDKNLPELIINENSFVKHIKFDSINKDNYFLPALIQNLQRQQHYSQVNLKDIIEKNKNAKSFSFKRNSGQSKGTKAKNLTDSTGSFNLNGNRSNSFFQDNSHSAAKLNLNHDTTKSEINLQHPDTDHTQLKNHRPKLIEENTLNLGEFKGKHVPRDNLDVIRSVRRDRLNPRELNEFYESKMNLLRIGRRFDQYRIKCSKRCEFKHATFLNTYATNSPRRDDDDYW